MPRESTSTRERLLRAGEHAFAHAGVHAAQTRDIVRLAGQANDSAVHYHFGSRDGLLLAICELHIAEMEPARAKALAAHRDEGVPPDLAGVVAGIVRPTLDQLKTESGRDFLLIAAQLASLAGVGTRHPATPLGGTALMQQLTVLETVLRGGLPRAIVVGRIAAAIGLLTSCLAERSRLIASGARRTPGDAVFAADLEAMIVGLLAAPPPARH